MNTIESPNREEWSGLIARPQFDHSALNRSVEDVLKRVESEGDSAVRLFTEKFDGVIIDDFRVDLESIDIEDLPISTELKAAIDLAARNIEKFHSAQILKPIVVETTPGVKCWQKSVAIERVGLYIPGGTAPLFSTVLMLAIPARLAGCSEIILSTPPSKSGDVHPAILYAAKIAGVTKLNKIGGVQAIGAMAYGTETISKVDKIFGPGNSYVTTAKQIISRSTCAIDMPAGPSEVAVVADSTANPKFIASDLLSQAEHGVDSQAILITDSRLLASEVSLEVKRQLKDLPRAEMAAKSLENSRAIVLDSIEEVMEFSNLYAPEHLIISMDRAAEVATKVINAGSVFIGHYTPESAGDYASGTNHTLPTHGWARSYSGVNMDGFCKKITFQEISREGILAIGPSIEIMAETELLQAHKNAATLRIEAAKEDLKR